jgi:hypothetical protein
MAVNVPRYQTPGAPGVLLGSDGNDNYQGGAGYDVAQIDAGRRDSIVTNGASGPTNVLSTAGVDTLNSVETLLFIDGREVYNPEDHAAQVSRLYDIVLGRDADQGGLNFSINAMDGGASMSTIASSFLNSGEFTGKYGQGLTNAEFVHVLYENMRGADGSASEVSFWTTQLDNGSLSLGDVATHFANSAEGIAANASTLSAGIWDRDESAIAVANLYDAAFDRLPDEGGLATWVNEIHTNGTSMGDIAKYFYSSGEAQAKLAPLSDADFVNAIYQNALDRDADATGMATWTSELASGHLSRADVILFVSDSPEHQALTSDLFQSENPLSYGVSVVA